MHVHPEPDAAFARHPDFGIVAAVADDRPFLDEVLRKHHFFYSQPHDIYLLPSDTPHTTAVHTVASATREFQEAGLSVAADPKILLTRAQAAAARSPHRRRNTPADDTPAKPSFTPPATLRRSR
ncbi:hypothetical protein ACOKM5_35805 [Streptomyces sp. BH097]|uniref:hypothetical protein n=1 Tax=unclassified Streptomyces TaxID=2593676 RepID=UPI003BB5F1DF